MSRRSRRSRHSSDPGSIKRFNVGLAIVLGLGLAFLLAIYFFRPIGLIHGLVMFFYINPLLWKAPIIAAIIAFFLFSLPAARRVSAAKSAAAAEEQKEKEGKSEEEEKDLSDSYYYGGSRRRSDREEYARLQRYNKPLWTPVIHDSGRSYSRLSVSFAFGMSLLIAVVTFFGASLVQTPLNNNATYQHYTFKDLPEIPQTKSARIMPYEVALQVGTSGFDSSTERLGQLHMVGTKNGELTWTYGQLPNGFFRKWSKKTEGLVIQPADITSRELDIVNQKMDVSPDLRLTDNLQWQLYKKDFLSEVSTTAFMLNDANEPVIVAPYIKYEGFWTKVPVLGGVYVVSANGDIEDLSPEEAAAVPFLARSGQIFPASLSRSVQESYKYKGGIINRFFTHEDQIEIADSIGGNIQPYLTSFAGMDPQWVSTAEPHGKSFATKAVLLTDSVTGETNVWQPPEDSSLSGNARALEVVQALAIPGILFTKFEAIEPRPIVHEGKLQFIVSVVPDTYNGVTKTVIVDAASNKAVAIFNHDTDANADADLRDYIAGKGGDYGSAEILEQSPDESGDGATDPTDNQGVPANPADQAELIKQLIENIEQQQLLLEQLQGAISEQ